MTGRWRASRVRRVSIVALVVAVLAGGFQVIAQPHRAAAASGLQAAGGASPLTDRVRQLTRDSTWTLVASIPIAFRTFHPQGLVKIGETFVVSSVEVTVPTKRFAAPVNGYDRDTGEGVGHLFKFDARGALIAETRIGGGEIYHPGGLDYDGTAIWVPVTEYRPDSRSILYRVDPASLRPTEVVRVSDSIGGVAFDTESRTLYGLSWGSRRIYAWALASDGRAVDGPPTRTPNPSHYVDYQDCKYVGGRQMLCTGIADIPAGPGAAPFRLGGLDLVNLVDYRPIHQVPLGLRTPGGAVMAQNPSWFEATATGLRAYFVPEDDRSNLYVYEVTTK